MTILYNSKQIFLCLLAFLIVWSSNAQTSRTNNKSSNAYRGSYQRFSTGFSANYSFEIKNGTLWGCGRNFEGQLGDGTTTQRNAPIQIGSANNWISISLGTSHTVALRSDGTLWGWGRNLEGQLGDGTTTGKTTPLQIGTATDWVSVIAGYKYTIAIKSDGTLWAWGENTYGQLGDGTTTGKTTPLQIGTATDWVSIFAGRQHTLGLKSNGTLWAWGNNFYGQLGDGTTTAKSTPFQIGTASDWLNINGGQQHSLGIKSDGTLWAWGDNSYGQLGDASNIQKNTPAQVGTDNTWVSTTGGLLHSLGIKSDGTLWAWGYNGNAALGDNTYTDKNAPVQVGTATTWVSVKAGSFHSIALKSDGTLSAWGENSYGQLGDGTTFTKTTPVKISTNLNWVSVAGSYYRSLSLKSDGTLWACGQNAYGELGDGSLVSKSTPVQIGSATNWASISIGLYHSVGLKSDGSLWAWGYNSTGQLGDGTTIDKSAPTQIGTATNWVSVACGRYYTIALKSDGTLWAWGQNTFGQLGDGSNTQKTAPVQIGTATNWVSVAAGGGYHTLGLKSDGTLWAWGNNGDGQLGDVTFINKTVPVQVGIATTWVSVTAGGFHTLALKSDGSLWAWGYNFYGSLGDGTTTSQGSPVQIGTATNWVNVTAGSHYSVALKTDGTISAWGRNNNGQLGDGTTTQRNAPVQISGQVDIVSLMKAPGSEHSGLLSSTRNKICFTGKNDVGQLGDGTFTNATVYNCTNNVCLQYTIAAATARYTLPVGGTGNRTDFQGLCSLVSAITPSGASPVAGNVADSVWVEASVPFTTNGDPYVQRHYGITPATNATTATGTVVLYFTQAEFTAFNAAANHGLNLPVDATDAANNKANLRVIKKSGVSNNATGLYNTYSGTTTIITPTSVVWSTLNSWWEVTFDVTGFSGFFVNTSLTVLALHLDAVSAKLLNNDGVVTWQTTNEVNTSHFEIERSTDGRNFINAGRVNASGRIAANYTFTDKNITALGVPVIYYRLKMIDNDGKYTYSKIIPLNIGSRSAVVMLYPNPVRDAATVTISTLKKESINYTVIDQYGRIVIKNVVTLAAGINTLSVDTRMFAAGAYTLMIRGTETNEQVRFIKF